MVKFSIVFILLSALATVRVDSAVESRAFGWICDATKELFVVWKSGDQFDSSVSSARVCLQNFRRSSQPVLLDEAIYATEVRVPDRRRSLVFKLPRKLSRRCSKYFAWKIEAQPKNSNRTSCNDSIPYNDCLLKVGWRLHCSGQPSSQEIRCLMPPTDLDFLNSQCRQRAEPPSTPATESSPNATSVLFATAATNATKLLQLQAMSAEIIWQLSIPLLLALMTACTIVLCLHRWHLLKPCCTNQRRQPRAVNEMSASQLRKYFRRPRRRSFDHKAEAESALQINPDTGVVIDVDNN